MAIKFPKKQEQRLIPKYLLEYSEELAKNHPDPTAEWGGSGVADIDAGTGIEITGETTKTISVDDETVAMVANLAPVAFSGSYSELSNKPDLSVYELKEDAFSGDYEDLTNKPDIPTKTSDLTNDSNFIPSSASNTKTYMIKYTAPFGDMWSKAYYESDRIGFENQDGSSSLYFPTNITGTFALTSDIPTKVSDLTNDAGYLTAVTWNQVTGKPTFATVATTGNYNDLSNKPDLSVYELKADAFSGSYNDLTDKPTIPTVGNGTITIKKNNTTVSTFTTNQSTNKSINITVPTDTSDLTNGAGFITAAQVPAGWEVVDVYQTHGDTPISAADLAKLAGDNVCIRYHLDHLVPGTDIYELYYKKSNPELSGYYDFDSFDLNYNIGTSYIGFNTIHVDPTTGVWTHTTDNRVYAGHKIESGSGLTEGSLTTSYGKTLAIDTSVVALKRDIPTVNNKTITIQKNGTNVDSFTLNQSTNKSINITVPTATSDLNNDSGFITGITSSDVVTALGYTPGTSNFTGFEVIALAYNQGTLSPSDYAKLGVNTIITRSEQNTSQVWTYTYLGEDDTYIKYCRNLPESYSVPGMTDGEFRFKYLIINKTPSPNRTHAINTGYNYYYVKLPTVVDTVADGNMNAVTSNAVYDIVGDIETLLAAL